MKIQVPDLNLYATGINQSFRCDLALYNVIQNASSNETGLSVTLNSTQWEAFGTIKNKTFNQGQLACTIIKIFQK